MLLYIALACLRNVLVNMYSNCVLLQRLGPNKYPHYNFLAKKKMKSTTLHFLYNLFLFYFVIVTCESLYYFEPIIELFNCLQHLYHWNMYI